MRTAHNVATARALFPRGLEYPEGAFRSSVDALLLANIIPVRRRLYFVELGTGTAMASCALALRLPDAQGVGFDVFAPAVAAGQRNVVRLGLDDRVRVHCCDVGQIADMRAVLSRRVDVVFANPPYRAAGAGRQSPSAVREQALVDMPETLPRFCTAAAHILPEKGCFYLLYNPSRISFALHCMRTQGFGIRRITCIQTTPQKAVRFVLIEGRLHCADDTKIFVQPL